MTPLVLLLAIISLLYSADSQACNNGSVRLMYGSGPWEGNVQLCYNGKWGWVCDNSWDSSEARVVCGQLGYSTSNVVYRRYSYYGWGNGTIWLDYLYCGGYESNLLSCSHAYSVGVTYCGYGEMAGVFCRSGGTCSTGQVRIVNNYVSSYGRSEGRVEYCYSNQWGTVCDDYWGYSDARVVCYQLGYSRQGATAYSSAYFGWGSGNIWLDNVHCSGSENSLSSCSKSCIGCHNCYHGEDAGVRCYTQPSSTCSTGDVRIWSAYNHPDNEGMLQYCRSGTWYGVCHYYYSCYIGKVACKQLGYAGARILRSNAGFYYGYYYNNDYYRFSCSSSYSTLSQCSQYYYYYCGSYNDALGIVCHSPTGGAGGQCTTGDVRLVDGVTKNEGRVEYCNSGEWAPMCSLSTATASLVCQKLGYTNYTYGSIFSDQRFGRSDKISDFNYLSCSSSNTDLTQCTPYYKGSGCYISTSTCGTEYGLRCYTPGQCTDGQSRLINGTIVQEGRVEVCVNGVWGGVCQWGWSSSDAFVFCNSIGYDGPYPSSHYYNIFGEVYGPIVWSYISCNGWEKDLFECSKYTYLDYTCPQQYSISVTCKEACTTGDVRLVGGGFDNEGTVEVCFYNLWGLVSDAGWTDGDARVVCNQLGYKGGIATPIHGSKYGKPNKTIHLKDVSCAGHEHNLAECTKTQLYWYSGKLALPVTNVAGVDCIYDVPTEPPCVPKPQGVSTPGSACSNGTIRLNNKGIESQDTGRVEYCYNGYWTPLCQMDSKVASVICRQHGHTSYTWATVDSSGTFGVTTNYSLFANLTCTGSETSISQCTLNESPNDCTPWCPFSNIALRCFDPGQCTEGSVRLADGIIENEGRVEFCVNGVWGSVCDDGWDKTDAHIVCTQLGHPELEPIVFSGSYFGDGIYPIIYSNMGCGGWESNIITECKKQTYNDFSCTRDNIAGVLCGYDCKDGDIRLVGGKGAYEGTIEVCFENLWGLVAETGWTQKDAEIVCKQLGYTTEGTIIQTGSYYGKPNKTIHFSDVQCTGDEETISECTATSLSLEQGKSLLKSTAVAGVKCNYTSNCTAPPTDGTSCIDAQLRLTGDNAQSGEGNLQYCYKGTWSSFCSLGPNEATVACRQLGFTNVELVSVYTDGRYGSISNVSLFQSFSCSTNRAEVSLSGCNLAANCMTQCKSAIGIHCADTRSDNCQDGDVRLVNGSIAQEGRVEVCLNSIWGSLCGDGFDKSDGFVVCRELGLGEFEPTVYTNSYFGDGNGPIVYSNLGCRGYETTVVDCPKLSYGSFTCSRKNIAGLTCQDNCKDGDIKLVGGTKNFEGTVEICYFNYWGLITDTNWDDQDAKVACRQLGYTTESAVAVNNSYYGKPNKTVQLSNVGCNGTEDKLDNCDGSHVPPDEGRGLYLLINAAGVNCYGKTNTTITTTQPRTGKSAIVGIGVAGVFLAIAIVLIVILILVIVLQPKFMKRNNTKNIVTMSSLQASSGVVNRMALPDPDIGEKLYD